MRLLTCLTVTESRTRAAQALIILLGGLALAVVLAFHNITDGDLWAKLAIGETLWNTGSLPRHDLYAFTPTLPQYIDHEWGAGVVFYTLLRWFGPASLMVLKIALALGLLAAGYWTGRRQGCDANVLLLLAIPAAASILTGYIPVVRCHAFTFFLFAGTLFCAEELWRGRRWPAAVLPLLTLAGANLHGGFVVALAVVFLYCAAGCAARRNPALMVFTAGACAAVTLVNPYGLDFWRYLIPALLHPRARIAEFRPPAPLAWDDFTGFRVLFVLTVVAVAAGWRKVSAKNCLGLAVLALSAALGWRSRRHGPFLGAAALAFAGPYVEGAWQRLEGRWKIDRLIAAGVVYVGVAIFVAIRFLPGASLQPLAPVGEDPVREADILSLAGAKGNLATPFAWGSYLSWRLYPAIKVSMDGRYETTYPETTFDLNNDFFDHQGDWFRLCREYKVDYVILDLGAERLRVEDLQGRGYVLIWQQEGLSALLCLPEHAALLRQAAAGLPPATIDPLDVRARRQGRGG